MKIVTRFRNYFEKRKLRRQVQAMYYSAASQSPSMDFSFAGAETLTEALKADLTTLRQRIRYELRQNGQAKGICRTYANAVVGTSPHLSVLTADKAWAKSFEHVFNIWSEQCGYAYGESLSSMLHLGVRQFFSCGEYFCSYRYPEDRDSQIKLRLLLLRPDRVSSPWGNDKIIDGVEFGENGRPVNYYLTTDSSSLERQRVPAESIDHVFQLEDVEQVRGEPMFASGLRDLHQMRRFDEARTVAAIVAAKYALFLTAANTEIAPEQLLEDQTIEVADGLMTVLPPGYDVKTFTGGHPNAQAKDFRRELVGSAGAAAGMSANMANNDSGEASFAAARYDDVSFQIECRQCRHVLETRHLNRLAQRVLEEAEAIRLIASPPEDIRFLWRWDNVSRHTDPLKAANANRVALSTGEISLGEVWGQAGHDTEEQREMLLEEVEWFQAQGLKHPLVLESVQEEQEIGDDDE